MRSKLIAILSLMIMLSCRAKDSTPLGVQEDLKNAMQSFLYNSVNNDSAKIKYHVEDVAYYEDTDKYICRFTVNLKIKSIDSGNIKVKPFDTTGIMKANISKDFKKITRTY